jgi:hypothetical protein
LPTGLPANGASGSKGKRFSMSNSAADTMNALAAFLSNSQIVFNFV